MVTLVLYSTTDIINTQWHPQYSVLSISFEVDISTGKVGGILFKCRKLPRGAPTKILKFRCLEMLFSTFSRQYLGLKNNQIQTILTIIYSMFITTILFLNFSHWLLEKSEMINLQMLIQKSIFNVLSSRCPFEKTCSAMSASVSLAWTPFWHMQKPGI